MEHLKSFSILNFHFYYVEEKYYLWMPRSSDELNFVQNTKYLIYLNSYAFSVKVRSGTLGTGGRAGASHPHFFASVWYTIDMVYFDIQEGDFLAI